MERHQPKPLANFEQLKSDAFGTDSHTVKTGVRAPMRGFQSLQKDERYAVAFHDLKRAREVCREAMNFPLVQIRALVCHPMLLRRELLNSPALIRDHRVSSAKFALKARDLILKMVPHRRNCGDGGVRVR